jgi:hypothetical protein
MDKIKPKTAPQTFLHYLLDEYILFRRDFVIETPATIGAIERRLRELNYQRPAWFFTPRVDVTLHEALGIRHYNIAIHQRQKRGHSKTASAEGILEYQDIETTRITGKVLMAGFSNWMAIVFLLAVLLIPIIHFNQDNRTLEWSTVALYIALLSAFFIILWARMYMDCNYLLKQLQWAVYSAERDKNLAQEKAT